jgi:hypothetical protein
VRASRERQPPDRHFQRLLSRCIKRADLPQSRGQVFALIDPRASCSARAASTRSRISADLSPVSLPRISWYATAGTSMCRSMRSRRGPLILPK